MVYKSIDDYKMVVHNSSIVINHCKLTDFPTLIRQFGVRDKVCHRVNYIGIHYDPEKQRLFLPRGIDVDYVRRKVESTMDPDEFSSYIARYNHYDKVSKRIKMKMRPRDDVQKEALNFGLCKGKYYCNSCKTQFAINLTTGKGKTYIASCIISYLGIWYSRPMERKG